MNNTIPLPYAADTIVNPAPPAFTEAPTQVAASGAGAASFSPPKSVTRSTVLPRVDGGEHGPVQLVLEDRPRYEPLKMLGAGGMGEVILVRDHDIARPVAQKRLLPNITDPALLARFVDEIRTVGRLEHPNIVPIHDVGLDELGRYFFVMKYVEGQTLESIIEKLAAEDPSALREYAFERRIELFIGVLHAIEYAHQNRVVHRDIKPANVMVGRYGEVVLMDWGIAKSIGAGRDPAAGADGEIEGDGGARGRMFATRIGAVIGTPAYMSPEQARGENDRIDERSDLYSAAVMFQELICRRHYLADKHTLEAMLEAVIKEEVTGTMLLELRAQGTPMELIHFVRKGLAKDPAQRFQSAGEMIAKLQGILEGDVQVECPCTFTKRVIREAGRFADRHPFAGFGVLLSAVGVLLFAAVMLVRIVIS